MEAILTGLGFDVVVEGFANQPVFIMNKTSSRQNCRMRGQTVMKLRSWIFLRTFIKLVKKL